MNTHDIKRYAVSGDIAYPIHEDPEGDYVTYDDHVAAIEADRKHFAETLSALSGDAAGMYEQECDSYFNGLSDGYDYAAQVLRGEEKSDDRKRRGVPVAWYTDDHLTDKSATTWDRTVAARWRGKGWPVGELFAAPQPQQIPEGYKLVPIDPTQEMLFAGDTEFGKRKIPSISGICYKAMLEAAPEPANPGREVEK